MTNKTITAGLVALVFVIGSIMTGSMVYAASNPPGQNNVQGNPLQDLQQKVDSFFDIFTELRTNDANLQKQIDAITSSGIGSQGEDEVKIYMKVVGTKSGPIEGSSTDKGHEGTIEILSYSHDVKSPRDAASGLPTGKRQHSPITITKEIDKATPLLFNVLATNENLPTVTLDFYRKNPTDTTVWEHYFTVKMTNSNIASEGQHPSDSEHANPPLESVSFTYQKIEWTWVDGGITAEDDWEAPVV